MHACARFLGLPPLPAMPGWRPGSTPADPAETRPSALDGRRRRQGAAPGAAAGCRPWWAILRGAGRAGEAAAAALGRGGPAVEVLHCPPSPPKILATARRARSLTRFPAPTNKTAQLAAHNAAEQQRLARGGRQLLPFVQQCEEVLAVPHLARQQLPAGGGGKHVCMGRGRSPERHRSEKMIGGLENHGVGKSKPGT